VKPELRGQGDNGRWGGRMSALARAAARIWFTPTAPTYLGTYGNSEPLGAVAIRPLRKPARRRVMAQRLREQ
jgi:hypothetical protein